MQDDCYLGVHARFVKQPTGVAGVLWKLQLDFDRWQVGVHVFAVFSRWDDPDKIDISRFPVRVVDTQPREAMKSPTMGGAEAYHRPPGKVEFILQETPVTSVIISMYGGGRNLGALYCARPEDPPPPPPKPMPAVPPPSAPPWWPEIHKHVNDMDAVITGAVVLHEDENEASTTKGLERIASMIVAGGVFALAMVAGGAAFVMRFCKKMRVRVAGRKVQRRLIRVQNEAAEAAELGLRIKLLFEDDDGVGLAVFMEVSAVESIKELQDLVLQTYAGAGMHTSRSDVLTLYYREGGGRMVPLTEDSSVHDVASGGVVQLARTSRARQKRTETYAQLTANLEPDTAALDEDDDGDTFSDIMESRASCACGTVAISSAAPSGPILPTSSSSGASAAAGRAPREDRHSESGEGYSEEDSDDDAELIYRATIRREASRAGAKSIAL